MHESRRSFCGGLKKQESELRTLIVAVAILVIILLAASGVGSGSAVGAFPADLTVEAGLRGFLIRTEPEGSDAQRQRTEKRPAEKAQLQTKQPPFIAAHELFGGFSCVIRAHAGILIENVGRHGIAEGSNNAGNDEQERPQKNKDGRQKVQQKAVSEAVKLRKQVGNLRVLVIDQGKVELCVAKLDCAANDKADERVDR